MRQVLERQRLRAELSVLQVRRWSAEVRQQLVERCESELRLSGGVREFYRLILLNQPPSILPISWRLASRMRYCLSLIAFISKQILINSFNNSNLLLASLSISFFFSPEGDLLAPSNNSNNAKVHKLTLCPRVCFSALGNLTTFL